MYSQEKEDAIQRKTLKHAGYRSKEKRYIYCVNPYPACCLGSWVM